jgi:hypothetical protein
VVLHGFYQLASAWLLYTIVHKRTIEADDATCGPWGAGGVGGLVGGALARAGQPVTLLVRPGRQHYCPERLIVESNILGTFEVPVWVTETLDWRWAPDATPMDSDL